MGVVERVLTGIDVRETMSYFIETLQLTEEITNGRTMFFFFFLLDQNNMNQ